MIWLCFHHRNPKPNRSSMLPVRQTMCCSRPKTFVVSVVWSILFFMVLSSSATTASTASPLVRHLEEHNNNNNDNAYDDNNENSGNNNAALEYVNDMTNRLEQDAQGMWYSAPSEWITEYWEVFGVTLLLLILLCACNCALCCCMGSNAASSEPRKIVTATREELTEQQQRHLEAPILLPEQPSPSRGTAVSPTSSSSLDLRNTAIDPKSPNTTTGSKRTRSSVLGEVVSVWSEFLGFSSPEEENYYKNMASSSTTRSRRSKRSKQRRSSPTRPKITELPRQDDGPVDVTAAV